MILERDRAILARAPIHGGRFEGFDARNAAQEHNNEPMDDAHDPALDGFEPILSSRRRWRQGASPYRDVGKQRQLLLTQIQSAAFRSMAIS